MARYRRYWYGIALKMITEYPRYKENPQTKQEEIFASAIENSMIRTKEIYPENYKYRLAAVDLVYFKKTHTPAGIKNKVYAGERTIYRWLKQFVEMVAKEAGY